MLILRQDLSIFPTTQSRGLFGKCVSLRWWSGVYQRRWVSYQRSFPPFSQTILPGHFHLILVPLWFGTFLKRFRSYTWQPGLNIGHQSMYFRRRLSTVARHQLIPSAAASTGNVTSCRPCSTSATIGVFRHARLTAYSKPLEDPRHMFYQSLRPSHHLKSPFLHDLGGGWSGRSWCWPRLKWEQKNWSRCHQNSPKLITWNIWYWLVVWNIRLSSAILGIIIPTNMFQRGWSHQPGYHWYVWTVSQRQHRISRSLIMSPGQNFQGKSWGFRPR